MSNKSVLITTTSSIEGYKIHAYKGIVSARVVTGSGIFSDWLASFSDVFGGRSVTYNNQLKSIYDEVIEQLVMEAKKLGANVILGLRIDHDEISGKGKQMFMVTAAGTAATIENYIPSTDVQTETVSIDKFETELSRLRLIKKIKNDPEQVMYNWDFILHHRVVEIMNEVFGQYGSSGMLLESDLASTVQYFAENEEKSKLFLYEKLSNLNVTDKAVRLLLEANLIDYKEINRLITDGSFKMRKQALALLKGRKRNYCLSDIQALEEVKTAITRGYLITGKLVDADKWECDCGKINKIVLIYCKSCDRDRAGFTRDEVKVEEAIAHVKETLFVLRHIFKMHQS